MPPLNFHTVSKHFDQPPTTVFFVRGYPPLFLWKFLAREAVRGERVCPVFAKMYSIGGYDYRSVGGVRRCWTPSAHPIWSPQQQTQTTCVPPRSYPVSHSTYTPIAIHNGQIKTKFWRGGTMLEQLSGGKRRGDWLLNHVHMLCIAPTTSCAQPLLNEIINYGSWLPWYQREDTVQLVWFWRRAQSRRSEVVLCFTEPFVLHSWFAIQQATSRIVLKSLDLLTSLLTCLLGCLLPFYYEMFDAWFILLVEHYSIIIYTCPHPTLLFRQ